MNKTELIKAIADKTGKSQKEAKAFLEAFESTVGDSGYVDHLYPV